MPGRWISELYRLEAHAEALTAAFEPRRPLKDRDSCLGTIVTYPVSISRELRAGDASIPSELSLRTPRTFSRSVMLRSQDGKQ